MLRGIGHDIAVITLQHNDSISPYCMSNANCGKRRAVLQFGLFCAIHAVFKGGGLGSENGELLLPQ